MANKSEWDIIKELYNSFGNNPNNVETFNTLANVNPLLAGYRGIKSLSKVDPKALGDFLMMKYQTSDTPKEDIQRAMNSAGNLISGAADVAPVVGLATKPVVAGIKSLAPMAGDMAENYMANTGMINYAIPKAKAKEMAKMLNSVDTTNLSQSDQMLLDTFGSKAEREAKTAKKVAKQAVTEKVAKTVERGDKLAPDYFRQLENIMGPEDVLAQASAGKHLKPTSTGGYVGAPRTVDSPQSLGAMRSNFDTQFENAANAIATADSYFLGEPT
jgi:hypothetical protein